VAKHCFHLLSLQYRERRSGTDKTGHSHLVNYLSGNTNTLSFASGYRIKNKIGQISRVDIDRIAAVMVT